MSDDNTETMHSITLELEVKGVPYESAREIADHIAAGLDYWDDPTYPEAALIVLAVKVGDGETGVSSDGVERTRCKHCGSVEHVPGDLDTYCRWAKSEYEAATQLGRDLGLEQ